MATLASSLSTSTQALITATSNTAITFLSLCNTISAPVVVNMYVVPAGTTLSSACQVYNSLEIPALDTYQIYVGNEKLILSPGDEIYLDASVDLVVSAVLSYTSV